MHMHCNILEHRRLLFHFIYSLLYLTMSAEVSHYVVTAHPPGAVLLTASCSFLSPDSKVWGRAAIDFIVSASITHKDLLFNCYRM